MSKAAFYQSKMVGASVFALVAGANGPALAQEASQQQAEAESRIEEIVVTGSRIAVDSNLAAPSPVLSLDAINIDQRGIIRANEFLNKLPQVTGSFGESSDFGGAGGTSTVDLRGLGGERTLVLVNGKRLPLGSPLASPPDVAQIPTQLIERIDIVTGGASAVYGSDAVGGVVNFIMDDNFEGVKFDVQGGFFQTSNENKVMENVLQNSNIRNFDEFGIGGRLQQGLEPPSSQILGRSIDVNAVVGFNLPDGKGNITAYVGFNDRNNIVQGERTFSSCPLTTTNNGTQFACSGSTTVFPFRIASLGTSPTGNEFDLTLDLETGELRNFDRSKDILNFAPPNTLLDATDRLTFGAFAHYDLEDNVEFYLDFSFSELDRKTQEAPGGSFVNPITISCDNPFLGAELVNIICTQQGLDETDKADVFLGRRDIEGGPRSAIFEFNTSRVVGGFRGDAFKGFEYDIFGQYAETDFESTPVPGFNLERLEQAFDVTLDPETGEPACRSAISGAQPLCVPFNLFQITDDGRSVVSEAAREFLDTPPTTTGSTNQLIFGGTLSGDLGEYGIQSPLAEEGFKLVGGFEYRREHLARRPDLVAASGVGGNFGTTEEVEGTIEVYELFMEARLPLIRDRFLISEFSVNGAARLSDFTKTTGTQSTYAAGVNYSPIEDVRLRAQFNRATRSPTPIELFSPRGISLFSLTANPNGFFDPCAGPNPARSLEKCARTGVTADQFGTVPDNPANEFNILTGGNENLDVEKADTWTAGIVLTPRALPGLTASIDFYTIKVSSFVGTIPPELALNECLDTGSEFFCDLVQRGAGGSLFGGSGFLDPRTGFIVATNINTGSIETTGLDFDLTYEFPLEAVGLGDAGNLRIKYVASYLDEFAIVPIPGEPAFECAGFFGGDCARPRPEYTHFMPVTWETPLDGVELTTTWRRVGGTTQFGENVSPIDRKFPSQDYLDVQAFFDISNLTFRVGVNNITDNDPPISSTAGTADFGDGNTFPEIFDVFGREFFLGVTGRF